MNEVARPDDRRRRVALPRAEPRPVAAQPAAARQFPAQPPRLLVVPDLRGPVRHQPVRRVHRQRPADRRLVQGRDPVSGAGRLSGGEVRRLPAPRPNYRSPEIAQGDRRERLGDLAADPLLLRHDQRRPADPLALAADLDADGRAVPARAASSAARPAQTSPALARHRQHHPGRAGAGDLRLPHLGAVRADPRR